MSRISYEKDFPDRESEGHRLAADLLTGVDAFGVEFIDAFRAGSLG